MGVSLLSASRSVGTDISEKKVVVRLCIFESGFYDCCHDDFLIHCWCKKATYRWENENLWLKDQV
jgi:hypothetical protein